VTPVTLRELRSSSLDQERPHGDHVSDECELVGSSPRSARLGRAACEGSAKEAPERPESEFSIFFPTVPRQDSYPAAVIEGTLEARDGCLFITRDSERWLLLWPKGYRPLWDGVRLRIFGVRGAFVGQAGEPIRLVGGEERPSEVGGAAAAERWASELTGLPMPDRCGDLYWIVSPE
jgi:hypothetical protein